MTDEHDRDEPHPTGDAAIGKAGASNRSNGGAGDTAATGIPFVITMTQRMQLHQLGHDDAAIREMTPEQAHRIIREAAISPQPAPGGNGSTDNRFALPDNPAIARLKGRKQWVAWKYITRNNEPTKPPVNPHTGRGASVSDPTTWGSYEQALACARRRNLAGIGYVLTDDDDLTGIDLDKVRDPTTGVIDPWAAGIVALGESYTEISPSGKGLRVFADGKVEHATKRDAASVEIYGNGRYLTLTGQHVAGTPIEIRSAPKTLAALRARVDAMLPAPTPIERPPRGPNAPQNEWDKIKTAALDDLDAWVLELFPKAERSNQGWRITSINLGRNLQEDLSFTPEGIKDWGVDDMGANPNEGIGGRTPIDVVMIGLRYQEHPEQFATIEDWFCPNEAKPYSKKELIRAAQWLCDKLGMEMPQEDDETWRDEINSIEYDVSLLLDDAEAADANIDELPDDDEVEQEQIEAKPSQPPSDRAGRRIRRDQIDEQHAPNTGKITMRDFYAHMQTHTYVFVPTRELWPASSVNARVPRVPRMKRNGEPILDDKGKQKFTQANAWLDKNRAVEQMTWSPGEPMAIPDRLIAEGGWFERKGATTLNLYRAPTIKCGNAAQADKWVKLVEQVYPEDADHIFDFKAHRVQHPEEKINHGLILGGAPGIGKDSMLEPLKHAVGPWNFKEVSPREVMEPYNDFMKCTVLRISEARDLGDVNRYTFYDHMKTALATPPDVMRVNGKYMPHLYIINVCGIIYTTNYKTNGIYLPADDRRTHVAWSTLVEADFPSGYWIELWDWYKNGGFENVAAFLAERDISKFDPKAPPKKTAAFWAIVDANRPAEEAELADVLDSMGTNDTRPEATTLADVTTAATGDFHEWLKDRKNRRAIPHRFEKCGYVPVRSQTSDGLWVVGGRRQVVYAREELSIQEQHTAVQKMISDSENAPEF